MLINHLHVHQYHQRDSTELRHVFVRRDSKLPTLTNTIFAISTLHNTASFLLKSVIFYNFQIYLLILVCRAAYARMRSGVRAYAVRCMCVCSTADNYFIGYKSTKSLFTDKHLSLENILLYTHPRRYIFASL